MRPTRDNYAIQADFARRLFLDYDQSAILENTPATAGEDFLYLSFACSEYRISRADGHLFRLRGGEWCPADSHGEVLTIFDYLCDAKPDRRAAGEFVSIGFLGKHVHTGLSIHSDALDRSIDHDPEKFRRACLALGAAEASGGDISFTLKLFPDLSVLARFWHADEDFPPKLDLLWDKNTLQFIRYETVWFASGVLRQRISESMDA